MYDRASSCNHSNKLGQNSFLFTKHISSQGREKTDGGWGWAIIKVFLLLFYHILPNSNSISPSSTDH